MGSAMAQRMLTVGHEVTVWNRDTAKTEPLVALGAKAAASPAALAGEAECIITMVLNADAIDSVYRGADGLLSTDLNGKLLIDMSTVMPETEEALARDVAAKGGRFVECPVGGTVAPAREGKLLGLAGGSEADMGLARPVLEQLCRRVEHVGPVGAGAKIKLAVNLPLMVYWQALGEALALCRPLGLDPARLMDLFGDSSGGANVLKVRGAAIASVLAGGDFGAVGFDIDSARKDLHTMLAEAKAHGIDLPLVERTLACFDEVGAKGWGARDAATLPVYWSTRKRG
jgi:3-hydroxyisobutyrate dehydrogenase